MTPVRMRIFVLVQYGEFLSFLNAVVSIKPWKTSEMEQMPSENMGCSSKKIKQKEA